ncbi:RNA 2',3'-cyclic phosphodiesterase [Candidatus Woesearchaeota archaeon]|jgi:2'-5' RNA ligase|nr:RNA 2',3'-cyclic phosphodiesterase [Candidatus Woesearchaeota archaeon]
MRYFLAIPLPEEIKQKLHSLNTEISKIKGTRLVSPDNMHLTLLFLGENGAKNKIDQLKKIKFEPFKIKTSNIVLFPDELRIRLVWIELQKSKDLENLQQKISKIFDLNKEYKPHITLARIKKLTKEDKKELIKIIKEINLKELNIKVNNFKLYGSELTVLGPVHRVIEYFESNTTKK